MKNFKINWTNNSIKYNSKEKNIVLRAMEKAVPFTQGLYLKKFETKFKRYLGTSGNAYAVANGSNALDLTAMLVGTKKGDEFIIPAHTWCATAISYARFGAQIKWADIDPETSVISLDSIKRLVNKKTKAIVIVHLYGMPANMREIMKFAKKKKLIVIEDCAQALGSSINKKKTGTFGDLSIFSFHSNKIFTTLGEGGMLVVNNKKFDKNVRALLHNGVSEFNRNNEKLYWKPAIYNIIDPKKNFWPYNFCIGEIQCALGEELVSKINKLNSIRIKRANKFILSLKNYPELKFQKKEKGYKNVYHCLVAKFEGKNCQKKRDFFLQTISQKYKIKAIVQNCPLDRYELFKKFKKQNLKNTNNFFNNMISWPFYTYMSDKKFNYMINKTKLTLDLIRKKFK